MQSYKHVRQLGNKALWAEVANDVISIKNVVKDIKNVMILDDETHETALNVSEPDKITNIGELIDDCSLVIRITGERWDENEQPNYYLCTNFNGDKYRKYFDGHIDSGGLLP